MLILVLLGAALVAGAPYWVVGAGVVALRWPTVGLVGISGVIAYAWYRKLAGRSRPGNETLFFAAMAAELRAGSSLRMALGSAAAGNPDFELQPAGRRAAAGLPASDIAQELSERLPRNGKLAGAAFSLAAATGARAADVFESLAQQAAERDDLVRERATLTAQARMSAAVVGGAPILVLVALSASGRGQQLLEAGPVGWAILIAGAALELAGLAVVGLMLWRAGR